MTFPLLDETTAPKGALEALATTKRNFGMIPNVEKVMALAPQLLSGYAHMWDLFETTTFTPIERQVVYMTANFENECNYCVPWHSMLAKNAGMEESEVDALRSGAPLADPKLEALRSFTRTLIANRGKASKADLQVFFDAGYSDTQAMAIRYAKQPPNDLEFVALFEDRFVPVCSPRLLENLSEDDWIGVIKQLTLLHFRWRQEDDPDAPSWTLWRNRARLVDRRVDEIESQRGTTLSKEHIAIDAAIAGHGVALASSTPVERELQTGALKCISNVSIPGRTFYAVNVKSSPRKHLIARFVEWATANGEYRSNEAGD